MITEIQNVTEYLKTFGDDTLLMRTSMGHHTIGLLILTIAVFRLAWRLTDDEQAAWDVLQDAWIVVSRRIGRLEDPALLRVAIYVSDECHDGGCVRPVVLLSSLFDWIPAHTLSVGETSGVRIAATIAVGGCLLAALGFGGIEYLQRNKPTD